MSRIPEGLGVAVLVAALAGAAAVEVQAQGVAVVGTVLDNRQGEGTPVPGLKVLLVHPSLVASPLRPAITDRSGRFIFPSVPPKPDPYNLEVYWGDRLIYRGPVNVGPAALPGGRIQVSPVVFGRKG